MNPGGEASDSKAKGEVVGTTETCWLGKDAEWGGRVGSSDSMEPGTRVAEDLQEPPGSGYKEEGPESVHCLSGATKIRARAPTVSIHSQLPAGLSPASFSSSDKRHPF